MDDILEENPKSTPTRRFRPKICIVGVMSHNFMSAHSIPPYETLGGAPVDPAPFLARWKGAMPLPNRADAVLMLNRTTKVQKLWMCLSQPRRNPAWMLIWLRRAQNSRQHKKKQEQQQHRSHTCNSSQLTMAACTSH